MELHHHYSGVFFLLLHYNNASLFWAQCLVECILFDGFWTATLFDGFYLNFVLGEEKIILI